MGTNKSVSSNQNVLRVSRSTGELGLTTSSELALGVV